MRSSSGVISDDLSPEGVNKVLEYYRLIHFRNIFALFSDAKFILADAGILLKLMVEYHLNCLGISGGSVVRNWCFHC